MSRTVALFALLSFVGPVLVDALRAVPDENFSAYQPLDALVHIQAVTHHPHVNAAVHVHKNKKMQQGGSSAKSGHGKSEAIRKNQVHNPRQAATKWDRRPVKRQAAPSAVPAVCLATDTPEANYGQCGGIGFTGSACCGTGWTCSVINSYYYQCIPSVVSSSSVASSASTTTSGSSSSVATTTTSSAAAASSTSAQICNALSTGSDGCTPYAVTAAGVILPFPVTFPAGGHVNYQAIACSQYTVGQTYLHPGAAWTPTAFGTSFDPNNNQPGGIYIGLSIYDFGLAAANYPSGFCVTWVQVSLYNQHWGEGGQPPVCSLNCLL